MWPHAQKARVVCWWKGLVCNHMPDVEVVLVPLEEMKEAVNNQCNTKFTKWAYLQS
jgi:hypothetical protein